MPPEGDYKKGSDGSLVMGDEKMTLLTGNRLLYDKNGAIEFADVATTTKDSILFIRAAMMLQKAYEQKNKVAKKQLLDSCIKFMTIVLKNDPKSPYAYFNRSLAYCQLDNPDSAAHDAIRVSLYAPDFASLHDLRSAIGDSYVRMGWEKYGKIHKYKDAIRVLAKGIIIAPDNSALWYNLGGAYYSNKQYGQAEEAFKQCLALDPTNEHAKSGLDAAAEMETRK